MVFEAFVPQEYCSGCKFTYYFNLNDGDNKLWIESNGQDGPQANNSSSGDTPISSGKIYFNIDVLPTKKKWYSTYYEFSLSGSFIIVDQNNEPYTSYPSNINRKLFYIKNNSPNTVSDSINRS